MKAMIKSQIKSKLKWIMYIDIAILLLIAMYKLYLFTFERNFDSVNITNIKKIKEKEGEDLSFAVLGKVENSIDIFVNRIIPSINEDEEIDFVVSNGDAILNGWEDKFRILNRSIQNISVPTIVGVGKKEVSNGGALRYYKHFGPFYFSFQVDDAYFIFLDTTGQTTMEWQKEWLLNELEIAKDYSRIFVFMNKLPYKVEETSFFDRRPYIDDEAYRGFLADVFFQYNVDAVFSSGLGVFEEREMNGVPYYVSGGGGGGLLASHGQNFYHYLKVNVRDDGVNVEVVEIERPFAMFLTKPIERVWIFIHSFFYTNMSNIFLTICLALLLGVLIYLKATKEVKYYRDFNEDLNKVEAEVGQLRIAMFTNNYFPFIGGVPVSIFRLAKGLRDQGHVVYLFAPRYPDCDLDDDPYTIRCKLMTYQKTKIFDYAIVNVFSKEIEEEFVKYDFDLIHVHHPFWMGKKGLDLGNKYGIPVILTYHTRLDSYSHYLPFMKLLFKNVISHQMIREFAQKCTAVFAPTETAKEYLANIGVSRLVEVLPTGIDFSHFKNASEGDFREKYVPNGEVLLCSVSRLSKEKNIYFLIECMKHVKKNTNVPFKCIIIGEGPERAGITQTIEEEGLQDTVILVGNVPPHEVASYYVASDFFVFTSKSETQGMVLLEAMAGKCPVVAVLSSGIEDVVVNGYNGYKTVEDVEAWSEKVAELLKNPIKVKEMSKNAYLYAREYSVEAMAERATLTYKKAMNNYRVFRR